MSKGQNRVSVCGHFAFGENLLNGQTVKTKTLTNEMEKILGEGNVHKIDTHGGKRKIVAVLKELLKAIKNSENIIVLPAQNGLTVIVPFLVMGNSIYKKRLHYVVIGGWLPEFLRKRKFLNWCLRKIDYIYVETHSMQRELAKQGFTNVCVMYNCKSLNIINNSELVYPKEEPYKLCTFSRVMKEKGIEDAINAVSMVNRKFQRTVFVLDIYGEIENSQLEWFEQLRKEFPDYVKYYGKVSYEESTKILKEYYAVLFPTYYEGEGFAGTIIDAFASGVPIIASDWKYNSEIIRNGENGLIFPVKKVEQLAEILINCREQNERWISMKIKCLAEAQNYLPENVICKLINNLM